MSMSVVLNLLLLLHFQKTVEIQKQDESYDRKVGDLQIVNQGLERECSRQRRKIRAYEKREREAQAAIQMLQQKFPVTVDVDEETSVCSRAVRDDLKQEEC